MDLFTRIVIRKGQLVPLCVTNLLEYQGWLGVGFREFSFLEKERNLETPF